MSDSDVQMLMSKIAAARAGESDDQDSDPELHSDSLQSRTPTLLVGSTGTQDTGATMPASLTTITTDDPSAVKKELPSPIEPLGGSSPVASVRTENALPARLSLETPVKREDQPVVRDESFGSVTALNAKMLLVPRNEVQFSQESSDNKLATPTSALAQMGLASPQQNTGAMLEDIPVPVISHKPAPIAIPLSSGLDALTALCSLASTPVHHRDEDDQKQGSDEVEPSPRKRPRRNVERRNWSTLSGETGELGEAACLDDEEEDAASSVARALAVARSPVAPPSEGGKGKPKKESGRELARQGSNGLLAAAASLDREESAADEDEDEDEELDTPEDEEDDEEWSPKDGDWSPKGRKGMRGRFKPSPRGTTKGKGHRVFPGRAMLPGPMDDMQSAMELPVDVKKGGKIPELIRSKRAASGFVGVDFHEGKWRARVRIGVGIRGQPNRLVIGRYSTAGEAAIAYAKYVNSAVGKKMLAGGTRG